MAKKKKNRQQKVEMMPGRESYLTPRRCVALAVVALCVLWLIQFGGVFFGGMSLWEDVVNLDYPYRIFTRAAVAGGEFPHWNPYSFGGMPFYATGAAVFYPFNAILAVLPLGGESIWYAMQTFILLHILIAGVCMFAYLRFKERSASAAFFGAAAYMFGGYMITHLIHLSIIVIAAWLPLLLMLLERGIRDMRFGSAVVGGLLLGMVMQAGHAQVMFYAVVFLLSYAVYFIFGDGGYPRNAPPKTDYPNTDTLKPLRGQNFPSGKFLTLTSKSTTLKRVIAAIIFFVVAAGLSLVQYLPMFEASGQTARIDFTINDAYQGSLQWKQLLTALMPKFFGAYTGDQAVPVFWLQDSFSKLWYFNYWETGFYFGVSTLILSVMLFRKIKTDRSLMFKAGWILLSFIIALGGNFFFYGLLYNLGIPGFNSFRHAPRILFIWGFFFPVMAAAVLDSLEDLKAKRLKTISLSLCGGAALLGLVTALGGMRTLFKPLIAEEALAGYVSQQGGILLANALLFGIVLILFFKNVINVKTAKLLVVACLILDMLVFASGQHLVRDPGAHVVFGRARSSVEQIKSMREKEIFRVNTRQYIVKPGEKLGHQGAMVMDRNQGYVSLIETTEGYNPFRLKYATLPLDGAKFNTMLDLLNVKYYVNPELRGDVQGGNVMLTNATCLPRAKLYYKAKVIDGTDDGGDSLILNYMNSDKYDHRNEVVVTDKAFEKFSGSDGRGKADITKYGINKIEIDVDTDKEAILWLSEIWYPAWKASVNGEMVKVHRANHSFRAIVVPPGRSLVVFKFDSAYFNIGITIGLLTLVAAGAYLSMVIYRRRKMTGIDK